ncbi:MAG: hypothetical protein P0Y53_01950 [Candidatus Pseudobacter hemicellulosilyticus]|uniref:DUF3592 domain-containing protein n=1 Tax=Candidatus Pseudobacter hemicellulosilyticus TaxID=3121375 RepID=A0AAJ5WT19_9BACT|nr:MAG: hypothetical protein P0Y53_01950 [Pseudobacter sp.]
MLETILISCAGIGCLVSDNSYVPTPVIRFVTDRQEWITGEASISFSSSRSKVGDKVQVVYSKDNPQKFMIKSRLTTTWPAILLVAGIAFWGYAVISLFI